MDQDVFWVSLTHQSTWRKTRREKKIVICTQNSSLEHRKKHNECVICQRNESVVHEMHFPLTFDVNGTFLWWREQIMGRAKEWWKPQLSIFFSLSLSWVPTALCLPNASIHLTTMKLQHVFCIFSVGSARCCCSAQAPRNRHTAKLSRMIRKRVVLTLCRSYSRKKKQSCIFFLLVWFSRYALPNTSLDGWIKRNYFSPQKVFIRESFGGQMNGKWMSRAKKKKWKKQQLSKEWTRGNSGSDHKNVLLIVVMLLR